MPIQNISLLGFLANVKLVFWAPRLHSAQFLEKFSKTAKRDDRGDVVGAYVRRQPAGKGTPEDPDGPIFLPRTGGRRTAGKRRAAATATVRRRRSSPRQRGRGKKSRAGRTIYAVRIKHVQCGNAELVGGRVRLCVWGGGWCQRVLGEGVVIVNELGLGAGGRQRIPFPRTSSRQTLNTKNQQSATSGEDETGDDRNQQSAKQDDQSAEASKAAAGRKGSGNKPRRRKK